MDSRKRILLLALGFAIGMSIVGAGCKKSAERGASEQTSKALQIQEPTVGREQGGGRAEETTAATMTPPTPAANRVEETRTDSKTLLTDAPSKKDKTLAIGIASEVRGFSNLNGLQNKYVEDLIVGNMMVQNENGSWAPELLAETPRLDKGTWKLNKDGSAEVIYRIRKGIKWHDRVDFTVHDIIFWWRVAQDKEIPWEKRTPATDIRAMEALDDYTLKVVFKDGDPEADTPDLRWFWPLPRHIMGEIYETDKKRFVEHPYWTTRYIGLGPYKVARFVSGSHLELVANKYFWGHQKSAISSSGS